MSVPGRLNPAVEYHVVNSLRWSSLRPLQESAIEPVRSGADCLLVAPTAGGKTEAALFPLLSEMVDQNWLGLSVIYVTPLKALLNNLLPRLESYGQWLGRTVGLWHGDVGDSARRRILDDPPDILLTTPESLEAMLVSRRVDHRQFFTGVRAIVVDEVHSFAGGDRGWHMLAVLERLQRIAGHAIQRIGLSATVGNPHELVRWLQGSNTGLDRPARVVVDTAASGLSEPEVTLDYVGSVENAAIVLASLFRGEKRLVFCQARAQAEELAYELRQRGVTTFVSHSSLSPDERRVSERAFAEARDCVIVVTSTLELGIDIGDLDRMVQLDAPFTVASFLQRLGRTGRRPGSSRNALFLTTTNDSFLRAAGLLKLWEDGYVEPVIPPPSPRHLLAQQLLALALQEGRFGRGTWREWWSGLPMFENADEVLDHLVAGQFLVEDTGMLFIGPRAESEFGRRYFRELLSSFVADLELKVIFGRKEIGSVSPLSLSGRKGEAMRPLLLAGRAWEIESVDWDRHQVLVHEHPEKGKVRWQSDPIPESFEMVRARRDVLLGAPLRCTLSKRAIARLEELREDRAVTVDEDGLVLSRGHASATYWTWAGLRANETLLSALGYPEEAAASNEQIRLPRDFDGSTLTHVSLRGVLPVISPQAVEGLKFSVALPAGLAVSTLAERFVDRGGAQEILRDSVVIRTTPVDQAPTSGS